MRVGQGRRTPVAEDALWHEILRLNPPVDWRLKGQASWVTYSLGRDQIPTGTDVKIRYADEALPAQEVQPHERADQPPSRRLPRSRPG